MDGAGELAKVLELPGEIVRAGINGTFVIFVGAGASRQLGLPSWAELANKILGDLRKSGCLSDAEIWQLEGLEPRKQLSVADLIAKENGIRLDFAKHLAGERERESIYEVINGIGCFCVTTNYDEFLAPRFGGTKGGYPPAGSVNRVIEPENYVTGLMEGPGTVVHLHGSIANPESMVVTTEEYWTHYDNQQVQLFLDKLFGSRTVLFLGYGLEEAEIMEHIFRRSKVRPPGDRKYFALQGFSEGEEFLYQYLYKYYMQTYGLSLLGFLREAGDYGNLHKTIESWAGKIEIRKQSLEVEVSDINEVLDDW